MKKTIAIPVHLQKSYLTDAEREELARFGDQPMTVEEIEARETEEQQEAEKALERQAEEQRKEILKQLDEIDRKSIRAIRAGENNRLQELEAQAIQLREALK